MNLCVLTVPGPVPSQSLKATPSEETISLSWKEPTEPNGVIIQYEVLSLAAVVEAKLNTAILWKNINKLKKKMVSLSLLQLRSATVACIRLTLRCLCNDQGSQCHCLQTPPITCFLSSTQVSHTSCLYEHRPLKGLVLQPRSMWQLIFQVEKIHFNMCCWLKNF